MASDFPSNAVILTDNKITGNKVAVNCEVTGKAKHLTSSFSRTDYLSYFIVVTFTDNIVRYKDSHFCFAFYSSKILYHLSAARLDI